MPFIFLQTPAKPWSCPDHERRGPDVVPEQRKFAVAGLLVEAWPVEHSVLAPAVGYRVTAGSRRIFYVPDVAHLPNLLAAGRDVDLYVGDGATLDRPLIRRRGVGSVRIGHATIRTDVNIPFTPAVL